MFNDGITVADMQSDVVVSNGAISGTLKYLDSGALVDRWGEGNFLALKFTNIDPSATSVMVGLEPTYGNGLVEIINDPDKDGGWKITDPATQVFKVVQSDGTRTNTQTFSLTGLTLESQ